MTLKILFMDLENVMRPEHIFHPGKPGRFGRAAGFCADLAYILVFGYQWLGEAPQSLQATKKQFKQDPLTDTYFLDQAAEVMSQADVIVTWYGKGHDVPFLASRLAKHGIYLDTATKHIDLYEVAKKKLRLSSNRLDSVAKFFGLETKMKVSPLLWADCWAGKYESLEAMAEYCRQDCKVLSQVYEKMLGLGVNLPHVGAHSGKDAKTSCGACGGETLIGNGYRVTSKKKYRRLRCTTCGRAQKGEEV